MKKRKGTSRGITLIEAVVSIAVISVISAALLSIAGSQARIRRSTLEAINATSIAENVIECFAFSSSDAELKSALSSVLGVENIDLNGDTEVGDGYSLTIEKSEKIITVTVRHGEKTVVENLSYSRE